MLQIAFLSMIDSQEIDVPINQLRSSK